jgi:uncharacterized protein DUF4396
MDPRLPARLPHRGRFSILRSRRFATSAFDGIIAAVKADTASITAWHVGMYGLMGVIQFAWLAPLYGWTAPVASLEFWFAMQLAMLAGFATSYPVNWWLIKIGWKERM